MDKSKIIICDIDETVSLVGQRKRFLNEKVIDWKAFYEDDFNDEPIRDMCQLIDRLIEKGYQVVFSTARCECVRGKTLDWLEHHIDNVCRYIDCHLLMRPDDCDKGEAEQKVGAVLERYDVSDIGLVIDDNDEVLRAWSERGVPVVKAALAMGPSEARKMELMQPTADQLKAIDTFVEAARALEDCGIELIWNGADRVLLAVNSRNLHGLGIIKKGYTSERPPFDKILQYGRKVGLCCEEDFPFDPLIGTIVEPEDNPKTIK